MYDRRTVWWVFIYDAALRLTYKPFEGADLAHHSGIQSNFEQSSACHFIQAYIGLHFPGHAFDLQKLQLKESLVFMTFPQNKIRVLYCDNSYLDLFLASLD